MLPKAFPIYLRLSKPTLGLLLSGTQSSPVSRTAAPITQEVELSFPPVVLRLQARACSWGRAWTEAKRWSTIADGAPEIVARGAAKEDQAAS